MGLDRVELALNTLGNPQIKFKAIHVAGTNGKGSTCAFIERCLREKYRTGMYTSPHLLKVNERIQINAIAISDELLNQRINEVIDVLGVDHSLTFFEFGTVVAFWHFAHENLDIAIIETGLGGRLDATTACIPLVTCLTPIGFDHMEYLGNTLELIAKEKCGIMKRGVPLVTANQVESVSQVIESQAAICGVNVIGSVGQLNVVPSLLGAHQIENAKVAVACLNALAEQGFPLLQHDIDIGLQNTTWPGRLELIQGAPQIVIDGAHNAHGVNVLVQALNTLFAARKVHLVFGVFKDKDFEPMMNQLFPRCASVSLVKLNSERSAQPNQLVSVARALCSQVSIHENVGQGVAWAKSLCAEDDLVLIAGSLTLVAEAKTSLNDTRLDT
jgi:dihydrofolate synthase / folylpolyglutamate synthase